MANAYPWYQIVDSPDGLQQGDILEGVVVPTPNPNSGDTGDVVNESWNLIVMTQSCDIEEGISHIVFCPIWTEDQLRDFNPALVTKSNLGHLFAGRMTGLYPISKSSLAGLERPYRIVHFQRIIELERATIEAQLGDIGPRLRVLPPYKEHLSQAFARFFMRVGLPVPLEK